MRYRVSGHALNEMARRGISEGVLDDALSAPEQVVEGYGGKLVYQSRQRSGSGQTYLVRVVVAHDTDPPTVVTAYRTTQLERSWRSG